MTTPTDRANERGKATGAAIISSAAAVLCAVLLLLGVIGIGGLREGNDRILDRLGKPASGTDVFAMDYTGEDGNTHHVSVESEPGESPAHLALRFREAVEAMKKEYPQRR